MRLDRLHPVWILAAALVAAAPAAAEEGQSSTQPRDDVVGRSAAGDPSFLDTPPFPGREISGAIRANLETLVAPEARIGPAHVTLVRPQLGMSADWPASERLVLRLGTQVATSRYRFHGQPVAGQTLLGADLDLYAARLSLEGAYRLTDRGSWFTEGESWSVLGSLAGSSRWEDGDFDSGLGATVALGLGYEIPGRLQLGLGATLRTSLEQGGLDPGPFLSLRWKIGERLTVRSYGVGLRVEYDVTPTLELHLVGTRASDSFRLEGRGIGDDLSFRDRHLRAGAGVDLELANWLRIDLEVGGTAERHLRVTGDDLGTLVSQRADPSVYVIGRVRVKL